MPSTTRRAFLSGVLAGAAGLAGCRGAPGGASRDGERWSQFGYDPANTTAAPNRGPSGRPDPLWVHLAGTYYRNSDQLLVGGVVYANAGHAGLYALSPADGDVAWHDPAGYAALSPALVDGDVVVPGGYGFRRVAGDGGVAVAGRRVGYRGWQTDLSAFPQSPPTVADGALIAGVGTAGHSPGGARVVAVESADGSVRWSTPVSSTVWGAPAVDPSGGSVYAVQRSTSEPDVAAALYALDLADGTERWRRTLDGSRVDPVGAPVVGDGLVYVPTGTGPLVAHDAASGEPVWTLDPPGGVQASPALADGVLYVGALDGRFHALDAATGDTLWTASVGPYYGGPTVGADGVYAVTFGGTIVSWRPDGTERWRVGIDPPVRTSPVVADGRLYVGTSDGLAYGLG